MTDVKICLAEGCGKPKRANGFCASHNHRNKRYGDPLGGPRGDRAPDGVPWAWLYENASYDGDGCLDWPFANRGNGYGAVVKEGKTVGAHREMCRLVNGDPINESDYEARHLCGMGHLGCVNPKHLVWGTVSENSADRVLHGTDSRGIKNAIAKLTDDEVKDIRALRGSMYQSAIGEKYGIAQAHVSRIQLRGVWSWLK